jgi:DNA-binding transcriptional ArsR family regulator
MSGTAMRWAWEQRVGNSAAKAVLLALADHADARGVCWPGVEEIARRLELDHRTVQRCLKRLAASGVIRRDPRRRADGSQSSNEYLLPIHPLAAGEGVPAPPGSGDVPGGSVAAPGGVAADSHAVESDGRAGAAGSHPHSIEPSKEPSKEPTIVNLKGERLTSQQLWEKVQERLKAEVTRPNYEVYFSETKALTIADERAGDQIATLVVECRSAFHADHISRRFTMLVRKFAYAEIGRVVGLRFTSRQERQGEA